MHEGGPCQGPSLSLLTCSGTTTPSNKGGLISKLLQFTFQNQFMCRRNESGFAPVTPLNALQSTYHTS